MPVKSNAAKLYKCPFRVNSVQKIPLSKSRSKLATPVETGRIPS